MAVAVTELEPPAIEPERPTPRGPYQCDEPLKYGWSRPELVPGRATLVGARRGDTGGNSGP